jgi:hypothetical protein
VVDAPEPGQVGGEIGSGQVSNKMEAHCFINRLIQRTTPITSGRLDIPRQSNGAFFIA